VIIVEEETMNRKLNGLSRRIGVASALCLALVMLVLPCARGSAAASRTVTTSLSVPLDGSVFVNSGEQPEWVDLSGSANLVAPSANVFVDADGARHAIISSPSDIVHSGFISPAPQDRTGLPQPPLGVTRFRVTFTQPGVYNYICALHDDVGIVGQIVVLP
jgi:plastocyanin